MKQIHKAVQALESDIGLIDIGLKRKKKQSFYYRNHTKNKSVHVQGKVFPLNQT